MCIEWLLWVRYCCKGFRYVSVFNFMWELEEGLVNFYKLVSF